MNVLSGEKADFIAGLLPVLDNLERAIEAAEVRQLAGSRLLKACDRTASSFKTR